MLIKFNTCVNAIDKWGFTPLHEASQKGRTQLCTLLVRVAIFCVTFAVKIPLSLTHCVTLIVIVVAGLFLVGLALFLL